MALREIDTREIPGNGGAVTWLTHGELHRVEISNALGELVTVLDGIGTEEARDAFLHTFAREDVPDVFARDEEVVRDA